MTLSQPTSKPRRLWKRILLTLLLLVTVSLMFLGFWQVGIRHDLANLIDELDKAEPDWRMLSREELFQKYPVSTGFTKCIKAVPADYCGWHNGEILKLSDALDYQPEGRDYAVRMPENYLKMLRTQLHEPEVAKLRQALAEFQNEKGDNLPPNSKNFDLHHLSAITNFLRDEILLAAHDQRWEAMVPLVLQHKQCTAIYWRIPEDIPRILNIAYRNLVSSTLMRSLALGTVPENILAQWQQELEKYTPGDVHSMIKLLRGVHMQAFETESASLLRNEFTKDYLAKAKVDDWWQRLKVEFHLLNKKASQLQILRHHQQALQLSAQNPISILNSYNAFLYDEPEPLINQVAGSSLAMINGQMAANMMFNTAIVGIACERYRLAKGTWPASLNDLVPQYLKSVPIDPYSGKPLLYDVLPDGVLIHSILHKSIGKSDVDISKPIIVNVTKDGYRLFKPELRGRKFESQATR